MYLRPALKHLKSVNVPKLRGLDQYVKWIQTDDGEKFLQAIESNMPDYGQKEFTSDIDDIRDAIDDLISKIEKTLGSVNQVIESYESMSTDIAKMPGADRLSPKHYQAIIQAILVYNVSNGSGIEPTNTAIALESIISELEKYRNAYFPD